MRTGALRFHDPTAVGGTAENRGSVQRVGGVRIETDRIGCTTVEPIPQGIALFSFQRVADEETADGVCVLREVVIVPVREQRFDQVKDELPEGLSFMQGEKGLPVVPRVTGKRGDRRQKRINKIADKLLSFDQIRDILLVFFANVWTIEPRPENPQIFRALNSFP